MSGYYGYDDRTTPMAPAGHGMPMQGMPMQQQMPMPPGYGYWGGNRFWRRPRGLGGETKPFYLTSEFVVSAVASVCFAITAAASTAFGAWRAWILISAIVCAYSLSRGIAKCGTRSRAHDPRENIELDWRHGDRREDGQHAPQAPQQHQAPTV